jgi:hypothetical protein
MEMCLLVRMAGNDHRQARQEANEVAVRGGTAPAGPSPAPSLPRPRFGG